MARQLTKQHALQIVKKLKAQKSKQGKAHQLYNVFHDNGILIASISVRHGSEKDQGHDHLQGELHLNTHKAKCLAQCTFSKAHWIAHLEHVHGMDFTPANQDESAPS